MCPTTSKETISVMSLVDQIEESGIECFKNCLLQTNQFSTRYVLTKVIKNQSDQVEQLKNEMKEFKDAEINKKHVKSMIDRDIPGTIINKFDLDNLNFIEANKIAIQLTEQFINLYQSINSEDAPSEVKILMERIIAKKHTYLESLKREYERLKDGVME